MFFTQITTIKIFTCSYIKKSLKKCLHRFNKTFSNYHCLKNQAIFFTEWAWRQTKGSLEEIEGVNDNASAFMHLNIKANK